MPLGSKYRPVWSGLFLVISCIDSSKLVVGVEKALELNSKYATKYRIVSDA